MSKLFSHYRRGGQAYPESQSSRGAAVYEPAGRETAYGACGAVIVNADDWGRDVETTDRTLECALREAISSVSAMVFMDDSERAASLARLHCIDAGLHLNLTTPFCPSLCPRSLSEHQTRIIRFLRSHRLARVVFHPGLATSFDYVVHAQLDEFERLYGVPAGRIDGHHHMHLCANVVARNLLPAGTIVRRNFSFWPGEKGYANRIFRQWQDHRLARRHRLSDYLFALPEIEKQGCLERIIQLAGRSNVEIETHPVNADEYSMLSGSEIVFTKGTLKVARGYRLFLGDRVGGEEAIA